jgi:hypothetical protein
MADTQRSECCARKGMKVQVLSVAPMEHSWEPILVEYYDMEHDWKCMKCAAQTGRTHYGERETLEVFRDRLSKSPWLNISLECPMF